MSRSRRRPTLIAALFAVVTIGLVWGPSYARGLSLVVRAAHMGGWLERTATATTHTWHAEPATTIPTRHGSIPARLYRPDGTVRRAAILTPGVHAMGIDEPRLKGLAGDLAASGVAVMTIALPDLVRYRFTPESVDEIEDAAAWLAANHALAPDGSVGLMGISFAGGLSMVAAGRPAIRDKVAYVFSFGGHGDLPRVLRYLCSGIEPLPPGAAPAASPHLRTPHDYGVAVILLGIADRMVPPDQVDALRRGIETYLTASQLTLVDMTRAHAVYDESVQIAASLPEPSKTLMTLVNARDTRALGARLLPVLEHIDAYPDSLSPDRSPLPKGPVYLLHGTEDTVIPSVETLLLASHLADAHIEVHALLSGLITHAEVDKTAAASETVKLVRFWGELLGE
jgi:dienelactone hydrolase